MASSIAKFMLGDPRRVLTLHRGHDRTVNSPLQRIGRPGRRSARAEVVGVAIAATIAVAVVGGCSRSGSTSSSSTAASHATAKPSGCGEGGGKGTTAGSSSGSTTLHLTIGARARVVIVHVPNGYTGRTRIPLVLNLHGSGSTAKEQEQFTGMDSAADHYGFMVAYPQGLIPSGTGFDWNVPNEPLLGGSFPPENAANDVEFLTSLVPDLANRYCIDAARVFATGVSGGGRMASQLACDSAGTFAAIAPVAGLRFPDPCPDARAVPVAAFHGTADPIDPYQGNGQAYWTYSVPAAAQRWADHDGCTSTPRVSAGPGYTLTTYSGCSGSSSVALYSLSGEGHEWPGGPTLPLAITKVLGPQSNAVDANSAMWSFFDSHPLS